MPLYWPSCLDLNTVHGKILEWEKLANCGLFVNISLANYFFSVNYCIIRNANQSQKVQFHYKKHANPQIITDYLPPKVYSQWFIKLAKSAHSIRQLVQGNLIANILPLQNLPMYGTLPMLQSEPRGNKTISLTEISRD